MASTSQPGSRCLITGAGGFVGQALAANLNTDPSISQLILTDVFEPTTPRSSRADKMIKCMSADLTNISSIQSLFEPSISCIYLLHGIMSSQAEAEFDLGLKVNIDSARSILDHLRATNPGVKVVFTSSTAVYGPPPQPGYAMSEAVAPDPQSSYGAQKHVIETLVNEYSRRGFIDGRVVRLPTVTVRPGKPTGAASSFASGIFREPLNGQKSILPVSKDVHLWITSPRTVVKNLMLAMSVPKECFVGGSRIINLPGITVSVQQMLNALKSVGGDRALALVEEKRDAATQKIVDGWPTRLDAAKAESLGFVRDYSVDKMLREYIEDYG